jgi:hypothetical protein
VDKRLLGWRRRLPEAKQTDRGFSLRLAAAARLAAWWLSRTVFSWWCSAHIDWSWPSVVPPFAIATMWSAWLAF